MAVMHRYGLGEIRSEARRLIRIGSHGPAFCTCATTSPSTELERQPAFSKCFGVTRPLALTRIFNPSFIAMQSDTVIAIHAVSFLPSRVRSLRTQVRHHLLSCCVPLDLLLCEFFAFFYLLRNVNSLGRSGN